MDFCSDNPIDPVNVHTKFEVCSFTAPEIIGVPPKFVQFLDAHAPFSVKFLMGFHSDAFCECTGQM